MFDRIGQWTIATMTRRKDGVIVTAFNTATGCGHRTFFARSVAVIRRHLEELDDV